VPEPKRIDDYALLGDLQSACLVSNRGGIDWMCLPRFDSPSVFAALLGDDNSGTWRIAPTGADHCSRRRYQGHNLILETDWETAGGTVRVTDFMPWRSESPDLVRIVEGLSGSVEMTSDLRIRFDYGRTVPWVRRIDHALYAVAGPDSLTLRGPVKHEGRGFTSVAHFRVSKGDRIPFVMTWQASHEPMPTPTDADTALADTRDSWAEWAGYCKYRGEWSEAVHRSLVVLKALTYAPTGGMVAAPTTSLPEYPGGVRNWDYRYCWLRDTTFTLQTLLVNGYLDEAKAFREWLLRAVAGDPKELQIMYGLAGERRMPEYEAPWLPGFGGAQPVRIGNAAVDQTQIDVYGEVMDSLHLARTAGLESGQHAWSVQRGLMNYLEGHWRDLDAGIWEVRGDGEQFVHSKVMAWVATDRAIRAVTEFGLPGPVDKWAALRATIHEEVCDRGYDAKRNTFVQHYGSKELDAALLLIPQVGFLPPDDPRVVGTIEAVERELCPDGLVLRYLTGKKAADGLPEGEGAFLACSFWLADDLDLIGRHDDARELFERLLSLRNDVGLLSEEYDVPTAQLLGNMPQAFSHVPMVNTANNLSHTGGTRHPRITGNLSGGSPRGGVEESAAR
jgi:GH15 family glucan-1,4-alpha-glucosidase